MAMLRHEQAKALRAKGMTHGQIADALGVDRRRAANLVYYVPGDARKRASTKNASRLQIEAMLKDGMTGLQIARECGVSPSRVSQISAGLSGRNSMTKGAWLAVARERQMKPVDLLRHVARVLAAEPVLLRNLIDGDA